MLYRNKNTLTLKPEYKGDNWSHFLWQDTRNYYEKIRRLSTGDNAEKFELQTFIKVFWGCPIEEFSKLYNTIECGTSEFLEKFHQDRKTRYTEYCKNRLDLISERIKVIESQVKECYSKCLHSSSSVFLDKHILENLKIKCSGDFFDRRKYQKITPPPEFDMLCKLEIEKTELTQEYFFYKSRLCDSTQKVFDNRDIMGIVLSFLYPQHPDMIKSFYHNGIKNFQLSRVNKTLYSISRPFLQYKLWKKDSKLIGKTMAMTSGELSTLDMFDRTCKDRPSSSSLYDRISYIIAFFPEKAALLLENRKFDYIPTTLYSDLLVLNPEKYMCLLRMILERDDFDGITLPIHPLVLKELRTIYHPSKEKLFSQIKYNLSPNIPHEDIDIIKQYNSMGIFMSYEDARRRILPDIYKIIKLLITNNCTFLIEEFVKMLEPTFFNGRDEYKTLGNIIHFLHKSGFFVFHRLKKDIKSKMVDKEIIYWDDKGMYHIKTDATIE